MSPARRLRLTGLVAAAAEVALGAALAGTALEAYFLVTAAVTLVVTHAAARFMAPPPGRPDGPDGPGDPEPPWWPDFERELHAHMRDRRDLLTPRP